MSFQTLIIETTESADEVLSIVDLVNGDQAAVQSYENYLAGINGGIYRADIDIAVGAVQATATLTSTGIATATETVTIGNVVFTARASGATGNEFNVSATVATQAANIAEAINASADMTGIATATSLLGVTTITSVVPGLAGNGLQISETLTNVALSAFAGGTAGTTLNVDMS